MLETVSVFRMAGFLAAAMLTAVIPVTIMLFLGGSDHFANVCAFVRWSRYQAQDAEVARLIGELWGQSLLAHARRELPPEDWAVTRELMITGDYLCVLALTF
jgi:hypothetical protein